jgi:hypothetical protein
MIISIISVVSTGRMDQQDSPSGFLAAFPCPCRTACAGLRWPGASPGQSAKWTSCGGTRTDSAGNRWRRRACHAGAAGCHFQGRLTLPPRTAPSNGRRCPTRCRSDGKSTCPSLRVSSTIRAQSASASLPSTARSTANGRPLWGCLGQRLAYPHLTAGVRHLSEREQLGRGEPNV